MIKKIKKYIDRVSTALKMEMRLSTLIKDLDKQKRFNVRITMNQYTILYICATLGIKDSDDFQEFIRSIMKKN